ncbi:MAG: hypothetical protein LBB23_01220 [Rickettsiales bacterium]|jgi:hypothetical protein|nr:hypothetical protein [Rickettsiales bacterium]
MNIGDEIKNIYAKYKVVFNKISQILQSNEVIDLVEGEKLRQGEAYAVMKNGEEKIRLANDFVGRETIIKIDGQIILDIESFNDAKRINGSRFIKKGSEDYNDLEELQQEMLALISQARDAVDRIKVKAEDISAESDRISKAVNVLDGFLNSGRS